MKTWIAIFVFGHKADALLNGASWIADFALLVPWQLTVLVFLFSFGQCFYLSFWSDLLVLPYIFVIGFISWEIWQSFWCAGCLSNAQPSSFIRAWDRLCYEYYFTLFSLYEISCSWTCKSILSVQGCQKRKCAYRNCCSYSLLFCFSL